MPSKWRRYEILLPLQFNDGAEIPAEWLGEATDELFEQFGALSFETQKIEGRWKAGTVAYRDHLARIVLDLPETRTNRQWMRVYRARWRARLRQLELWLISHPITVE